MADDTAAAAATPFAASCSNATRCGRRTGSRSRSSWATRATWDTNAQLENADAASPAAEGTSRAMNLRTTASVKQPKRLEPPAAMPMPCSTLITALLLMLWHVHGQ